MGGAQCTGICDCNQANHYQTSIKKRKSQKAGSLDNIPFQLGIKEYNPDFSEQPNPNKPIDPADTPVSPLPAFQPHIVVEEQCSQFEDEEERSKKLKFKYFDRFSQKPIQQFYTFERNIGGGHFGQVHMAHAFGEFKRKYAIKTISKVKISDRSLKRLENEIEILCSLDHPNIVRYFGTFVEEEYIHMVMELCRGGEVFEKIQKFGCMSEHNAAKIVHQVLLAVNHLHMKGITHRDIKPENIMYFDKDTDEVRLIDFGLSRKYEEGLAIHSIVGTPYYVAPEVLSQNYDHRCDIWSVGVVLYILLIGYPPFNGQNSKQVIQKIKSGIVEFIKEDWAHISEDAKELIARFLDIDLATRITIDEALEHPWFRKFLYNYSIRGSTIFSKSGSYSTIQLGPSQTPENQDSLALKRIKNIKGEGFKNIFVREMNIFIIRHLQVCILDSVGANRLFRLLDKRGLGLIEKKDLQQGLVDLGYFTEFEAEETLWKVNFDSAGYLSYSEFISYVINKKKHISQDDLFYAFTYFDVDLSGFITAKDLLDIFTRQGYRLKEETMDKLILHTLKYCGCKESVKYLVGSPKISFEDFCKVFYQS